MTAKNLDFAKAVLRDFVEKGLAVGVDDLTVENREGELIEFEPLTEDGETVGLNVFANDTEVGSFLYADENFAEELHKLMVGLLDL